MREQYRIYRLPADLNLQLIATCDTKEAVGTALITLGEEGEFEGCTVGVMLRPFEDKPGKWLVIPFPPSGDGGKRKKSRRSEGKPKRRK